MARHYIVTTVTFTYESDDDEFADSDAAEVFGWDYDNMMYDGIESIRVEEFPNQEEDEDDEDTTE
jgi:hypothetical protein